LNVIFTIQRYGETSMQIYIKAINPGGITAESLT